MTLSVTRRAVGCALITISCVTFGVAPANAAKVEGDTGPPATKTQCLRILKDNQRDLGSARKAFPALKRAAAAKVDARRLYVTTLRSEHDAIQPQIDAIMDTNTEGLSQSDVDAMNARIESLLAQQSALSLKVDMAEGKTDEAVLALEAVIKKHASDEKNWPGYIKQVKRYCAKM
jgi:hypothetical protein